MAIEGEGPGGFLEFLMQALKEETSKPVVGERLMTELDSLNTESRSRSEARFAEFDQRRKEAGAIDDEAARNSALAELDRQEKLFRELEGFHKMDRGAGILLNAFFNEAFKPFQLAQQAGRVAKVGAREGGGAIKRTAQQAGEVLKEDAIEIGEFAKGAPGKVKGALDALGELSVLNRLDPEAERGALMDAIFELDQRGLAPVIIDFVDMLRGMTAEGSKASPRAKEAERFAGR